jgi:hypothetical protein
LKLKKTLAKACYIRHILAHTAVADNPLCFIISTTAEAHALRDGLILAQHIEEEKKMCYSLSSGVGEHEVLTYSTRAY